MCEYGQESPTRESKEQFIQVHYMNTINHPSGLGLGDMPSLYNDYGLDINMKIESLNTSAQSVKQKYQAYIIRMWSPLTMNILKFWEVSI
jgi:hypothetical protein